MTKPKYTPGPWRRQGQIIWGKTIARKVAHIQTERGEPLEDNANARLISAAPEMLDALKELVEIIGNGRDLKDQIDSFTCQTAIKAIKKAEGGE